MLLHELFAYIKQIKIFQDEYNEIRKTLVLGLKKLKIQPKTW